MFLSTQTDKLVYPFAPEQKSEFVFFAVIPTLVRFLSNFVLVLFPFLSSVTTLRIVAYPLNLDLAITVATIRYQ